MSPQCTSQLRRDAEFNRSLLKDYVRVRIPRLEIY